MKDFGHFVIEEQPLFFPGSDHTTCARRASQRLARRRRARLPYVLDAFIAQQQQLAVESYREQVQEILIKLTQEHEREFDVFMEEGQKAQQLLSDLGIKFSPSLDSID